MSIPNLKELYKEYLYSPHWRARAIRFKEIVGRCEKCYKSGFEVPLQVHHRHYNTIGRETLDDIQVLCRLCHVITEEEKHRALMSWKQDEQLQEHAQTFLFPEVLADLNKKAA